MIYVRLLNGLCESAYTYSFIGRVDVSLYVFNGGQEEQQSKIQSYSVFFHSLLWTEVTDDAFNDADMPVESLNVIITIRIKALYEKIASYVTHDLRIMSRWQ